MSATTTNVSMFQIGTADRIQIDTTVANWVAGKPLPAREPTDETHLQLATTRAAFDALEVDWNELFDRAGRGEQMFQSFNWLWHWANHYCAESDALAIVTVRRNGRLIGLLPLAVERVAGLRQLVFMGAPVSQYGDALIDDVPDQHALLGRALRFAIAEARIDVVRLAKMRDDAAMASVMAEFEADVTGVEEAPFADLAAAGTAAAYQERFSGKTKRNRRRQERHLVEHGVVEIDWQLAGREAAHAARTTMVLKRAWLKSRGQLSRAFADRRTDQFFADVCTGAQRAAGAQVSLLTSGGEIANAAITVTVKGRMAVHILAYGMKFEKCAPGALHLERLVQQAFATGVTTLDLLAPRHDYKLEWCGCAMRVADYAVPVTLAGKAYTRIYLRHIREGLKAIVKAAPRKSAGVVALLQKVLR